jgi:hypothetical protein
MCAMTDKKHWLDYATGFFAFIAAIGAILAACFTGWQASIAGDAEQRQLRAYVGLANDPIMTLTAPDRTILAMKNFGQTPGKSVEIFTNFEFVSKPADRLPDDFKFPDKNYCPKRLYGTQVIYPLDILKSQRQDCPEEIAKLSSPEKWTAFIYGHILYSDVFGHQWRNNYCFLYGAANGNAYCDRYNEMDVKD